MIENLVTNVTSTSSAPNSQQISHIMSHLVPIYADFTSLSARFGTQMMLSIPGCAVNEP